MVIHFAEKWNTSPFEVFEKDIDDFILIVNSLISQNENKTETKIENNKAVTNNDGFWDM